MRMAIHDLNIVVNIIIEGLVGGGESSFSHQKYTKLILTANIIFFSPEVGLRKIKSMESPSLV